MALSIKSRWIKSIFLLVAVIFLIDVSVTAEVSLSQQRVAGFDIDSRIESEAAFRQRLMAREADINARGSATDGTAPLALQQR